MPGNPRAAVEKKDFTAPAPEKRLVLSPQACLRLDTETIWGDSVEAVVTVAVPDSCKFQRYVCWFEANTAVRFATIPRYQWALQRDSLKILSFVPLQIRLARQSFTASTQPPVIKIHYQNLDHAAKLSGVATLEFRLDEKLAPMVASQADSNLVSTFTADSSQAASPASLEAPAKATGASSFGIFYVALAILLIFLFGGLSWLMTWSQRRRFQKVEAKTMAMAFPHLQHLQPSAPAVDVDSPTASEDTARQQDFSETPGPDAPAASTANLPAVVSNNGHDDLPAILAQLHELNLRLQQVIANQQEANQRLARITAGAALEASAAPNQLALFDILNDTAPIDCRPSSNLRLLFANSENHDNAAVAELPMTNENGHNGATAADDILLH
ncbi:MAG: hypothetical protein ONB46_09120 [candidate division KSB1 bacterium]|nr:hypothetical protein [candidate division KSB1 bacterium]MDZ7365961.1 hypothetical protein [candidate division KSB1 bacterium]